LLFFLNEYLLRSSQYLAKRSANPPYSFCCNVFGVYNHKQRKLLIIATGFLYTVYTILTDKVTSCFLRTRLCHSLIIIFRHHLLDEKAGRLFCCTTDHVALHTNHSFQQTIFNLGWEARCIHST